MIQTTVQYSSFGRIKRKKFFRCILKIVDNVETCFVFFSSFRIHKYDILNTKVENDSNDSSIFFLW